MLLVKTYLASSDIEGIGLFANEDIDKGTTTWVFTPGFDLYFTEDDLKDYPDDLQDYIKNYASLSMFSNKYVLGSDNVKFTNHSSDPNLEAVKVEEHVEMIARAKKDIKRGEELTIDYRQFDKADAENKKAYF